MTLQQNAKKNYEVIKKAKEDIPTFNSFDLSSLEEVWKDFTKKKYLPEVIFIPKGLTQEEWEKLISYWHVSYISNDFLKGSGWEISVIAATPHPTQTNVSKETIEKDQLNTCYMDEYLSLQWLLKLLEREPVDKNTWTIVQEHIDVGGSVRSVVLDFSPSNRQVDSVWDLRGSSNDFVGVRPSARGQSLSLDSSSSDSEPLSSDLQANTEAILKLTEVLQGIFK